MRETVDLVKTHYNGRPEHEHTRLLRHQLEHDITWRYFERYLPPSGSILEIGAASGRYTLELAKRGYHVTAVDLSEVLITLCQQEIEAADLAQQVNCFVADARDLSQIDDGQFDAVLLMGPLYHLIAEHERLAAIQEASRKLRSKGMIFSSWISRFGMWGSVLKKFPEWIEEPGKVHSILQDGKKPEDAPKKDFPGYYATIQEIAPLHEKAGFTTCVVAAAEPAISADDESYNRLEGLRRTAWLDMLFEISTEESIVGASRHVLYIGEKCDDNLV